MVAEGDGVTSAHFRDLTWFSIRCFFFVSFGVARPYVASLFGLVLPQLISLGLRWFHVVLLVLLRTTWREAMRRRKEECLTWLRLVSLGLTWSRMVSLGFTWSHTVSLDFTTSCLVPVGLNWLHLVSLGLTWFHLVSLGFTFSHLVSLVLTCAHLPSLGFSWFHLPSLGFSWFLIWCHFDLTFVSL